MDCLPLLLLPVFAAFLSKDCLPILLLPAWAACLSTCFLYGILASPRNAYLFTCCLYKLPASPPVCCLFGLSASPSAVFSIPFYGPDGKAGSCFMVFEPDWILRWGERDGEVKEEKRAEEKGGYFSECQTLD
jgi:hypothetical protein